MRTFVQSALCVLGVLLSSACVLAPTNDEDDAVAGSNARDTGSSQQAIIDGVVVPGVLFDAVGAIVQRLPDGSLVPFCTGTVVATDAVLTAKHCLLSVPPSETVYFATGVDATKPKQLVPIVASTWDRDVRGSAMGLGSDTAIAHLAKGSTKGITPVAIGTLDPNDVGKRFVTIGYGLSGLVAPNAPLPPKGIRRAALATLRATSGKVYPLVYGTFQRFVDAYVAAYAPGAVLDPESLAQLQALYDHDELLDGYEAYFGDASRPFEGFTSSGDSGGPMLGIDRGRVRIFAVTSGSRALSELPDPAPLGGIYATLGPEAAHLVRAASTCGSLPEWGRCEGNTAARCADTSEGFPHPIATNCGTNRCSETPTGARCLPVCTADAECAGGTCVAGTCTWNRDCSVEGDFLACYLCCAATATTLEGAQACVSACEP